MREFIHLGTLLKTKEFIDFMFSSEEINCKIVTIAAKYNSLDLTDRNSLNKRVYDLLYIKNYKKGLRVLELRSPKGEELKGELNLKINLEYGKYTPIYTYFYAVSKLLCRVIVLLNDKSVVEQLKGLIDKYYGTVEVKDSLLVTKQEIEIVKKELIGKVSSFLLSSNGKNLLNSVPNRSIGLIEYENLKDGYHTYQVSIDYNNINGILEQDKQTIQSSKADTSYSLDNQGNGLLVFKCDSQSINNEQRQVKYSLQDVLNKQKELKGKINKLKELKSTKVKFKGVTKGDYEVIERDTNNLVQFNSLYNHINKVFFTYFAKRVIERGTFNHSFDFYNDIILKLTYTTLLFMGQTLGYSNFLPNTTDKVIHKMDLYIKKIDECIEDEEDIVSTINIKVID